MGTVLQVHLKISKQLTNLQKFTDMLSEYIGLFSL